MIGQKISDPAMPKTIPCKHCGTPFEPTRPGHEFCLDKCRTAWHRENKLPGRVAGIRALKSGGWSITIHQSERPQVQIGSKVRLENDI